jgi:hypothetical protein
VKQFTTKDVMKVKMMFTSAELEQPMPVAAVLVFMRRVKFRNFVAKLGTQQNT